VAGKFIVLVVFKSFDYGRLMTLFTSCVSNDTMSPGLWRLGLVWKVRIMHM